MSSLHNLHKTMLGHLDSTTSLLEVVCRANPVALASWGTPTDMKPYGHVVMIDHSSNLISAADVLLTWIQRESIAAPEWSLPIVHQFTFRYMSDKRVDFVGLHGTRRTAGAIMDSGHPEVPVRITCTELAPNAALTSTEVTVALMTLIVDLSLETPIQALNIGEL